MLFLLPPSETKAPGGSLEQKRLSFPQLNPARAQLLKELLSVCNDPILATKVLGLGPKQQGEIEVNLALPKAPTVAAIDRYTGVLYEALKDSGLTAAQRRNAEKVLLIQSALFGLISAGDVIPNYRISAGSKLPGVNLKRLWSRAHESIWSELPEGIIIDLRSKAYSELAPIPKVRTSYFLDVLIEDSLGNRRSLNHFNKQAKGRLARAVISSRSLSKTFSDLEEIATSIGMKLEVSDRRLLLITFG